jgi:lactam utilization protein B
MGPIKHKALINVDLGEGFGNWTITSDEELLPFIDHANIACGFHASYVFYIFPCPDTRIAMANRSLEMPREATSRRW